MLRLWVALLAAGSCFGQTVEPLRTLRLAHPRLIALDSDIERIRRLVHTDQRARRLHQLLVREAGRIEGTAPVEYKLVGPRLLTQSRRCLDRIYTLALLYRLDHKRQYLVRALKELRAAAYFPDWNPSHFLDTAEMTHAFAIGYDWLYHSLTPEERAWIRRAIIDKGIDPGIGAYDRRVWWTTVEHNWNQVCNGGIGLGALAIADEEPERAARFLRSALKSLPLAMASYEPDGGWAEGPGYWNYATNYTACFLAGLESALGTDFGLSASPGFDRAGHFRVYFTGPTWRSFNYADGGDRVGPASELFWLARKFSQPAYAWQQERLLDASDGADALDLIWYWPEARTPRQAGWPASAVFRGIQAAFLRNGWEDPGAIFVAVKGGDNKANHSHLDLGTFVLDAGGVRWALDLGADDYDLPQYFGKLRWTYYRLRTESHNTVLIDGENQSPAAAAPIEDYRLDPELSYVRIDLSRAYPEKVKRWERTVSLVGRKQVAIEDVLEAERPVEALWGMVTGAEIKLNGTSAELEQGGSALAAEIRSPDGAVFEVVSTAPPPPQNQNEGTRKLVVRLPDKVTDLKLIVTLTPRKR